MVRLGPCSRGNYKDISRISIPLWCDWDKPIHFLTDSFSHISIPLWCDWDYAAIGNRIQVIGFQFHYGAIGTTDIFEFILDVLADFNSIMVRLGPSDSTAIQAR